MRLSRLARRVLPAPAFDALVRIGQRVARSRPREPMGIRPVSDIWGLDRGTPIEIYWIREFLRAHRADIRGRVLEVGDRRYTNELGQGVDRSDVLDLMEGNPEATIVGDLVSGRGIPDASFDCLLIVNTFLLIYEIGAAIRTCHRALRPGGVLLANFTGIARRAEDPGYGPPGWHGAGDFWRYTSVSARRLCEEAFQADHVAISVRGSVRTAAASLYGLAAEELTQAELDLVDPRFEVAIFARAVRPR